MRYLSLLLCLMPMLVAPLTTRADDADQSPEDVFRRFMSASFKNDAEGIKATILVTKDSEILWRGNPPPKEVQQQMESALKTLKLTRIPEGETVTLPGGRELTVRKGMVDDNHILVWVEMDNRRLPTPFSMVKENDGWKVDPTPIVAARKAAARAIQQGKLQHEKPKE